MQRPTKRKLIFHFRPLPLAGRLPPRNDEPFRFGGPLLRARDFFRIAARLNEFFFPCSELAFSAAEFYDSKDSSADLAQFSNCYYTF
uniref:Uncharacterized protein n=1 Tax=Romanomermis culicivorax TaxID=13658 RepID=A0A915IUS1_ROMCU